MRDSHRQVVAHHPAQPLPGIFGRQHLDAHQRSLAHDPVYLLLRPQHHHIRHAVALRSNLQPALRPRLHAPLRAAAPEDSYQCALHPGVLVLAHIALLDPPLDIIAIGPIAGPQVLLLRDEGLNRGVFHWVDMSRHTASMLPSLPRRHRAPNPAAKTPRRPPPESPSLPPSAPLPSPDEIRPRRSG